MLVIKKSFSLTKILLVLYVFRFVLIAGSKTNSEMYNFIGELVILGFLVDVTFLKSRINWSNVRLIVPYFIFLSFMFLSGIWYPQGSEYIFDIFSKYLLFFICFFVVTSTNNFNFLFHAIILACVSIFILGYNEIVEYMLNPVNKRFVFSSIDDAGEGGINPNSLAFYCNISIGFLIYQFRLINKKYVQLGILALIGFFIFIIINVTLSRKGFFGILIMYFFFIISGKKRNLGIKVLVILLSLVGLIFLLEDLELPILDRFISTINFFEGNKNIGQSDSERSYLFYEAITFWQDSPIFGNGVKHFENNSKLKLFAHNNYLELLANYGLIGFALFYSPIIKRVTTLYKHFNHISSEVKFFFFILVLVLISDFAMVSYYSVVSLLILSVILGYNFNFKRK